MRRRAQQYLEGEVASAGAAEAASSQGRVVAKRRCTDPLFLLVFVCCSIVPQLVLAAGALKPGLLASEAAAAELPQQLLLQLACALAGCALLGLFFLQLVRCMPIALLVYGTVLGSATLLGGLGLAINKGLLLEEPEAAATVTATAEQSAGGLALSAIARDGAVYVGGALMVAAGVEVLLIGCFWGEIQLSVAVLRSTAAFLRDVPWVPIIYPLLFGLAHLAGLLLWALAVLGATGVSLHGGDGGGGDLDAGGVSGADVAMEDANSVMADIGVGVGGAGLDGGTAAADAAAALVPPLFGPLLGLRGGVGAGRRTLGLLLCYFWGNCFVTALSSFATAAAAAEWYFAPRGEKRGVVGPRRALQLVRAGLWNHGGSLALGSLLLALLRLLQFCLWWGGRQHERSEQDSCLRRFVFRSRELAASCLETVGRQVSKQAYVEVALSGCGFFTGARVAVKRTAAAPKRILAVEGAGAAHRWASELLLVGAVACGMGFLIHYGEVDAGGDEEDDGAVCHRWVSVVLACVGAWLVAENMMHPVSVATSTILHCLLLDAGSTDTTHTPEPLQQLLATGEACGGEGGEDPGAFAAHYT